MDADLKEQTETELLNLGLSYQTAIKLFSQAIVKDGRLPFETPSDFFESEHNQLVVRQVVDNLIGCQERSLNSLSKDQD
ncbi:type II toxin-antitoxin system RelB/DinJ family antitoxin [Secundilactobacillus paracollinoides]|uniref:type II toxin-antitoxin system RelB/DinJ family antitoxin n=1 Tax=Secundilactobacillus paracollinoides TaxID=240427 RepID=UPI001CDAEC65